MDIDKLNSKRKKKSGGITSRLRDPLLSPGTGRVTSERYMNLQLSEQTRVLSTPRRASRGLHTIQHVPAKNAKEKTGRKVGLAADNGTPSSPLAGRLSPRW